MSKGLKIVRVVPSEPDTCRVQVRLHCIVEVFLGSKRRRNNMRPYGGTPYTSGTVRNSYYRAITLNKRQCLLTRCLHKKYVLGYSAGKLLLQGLDPD